MATVTEMAQQQQHVVPMELGQAVQQATPVDIKQLLESTLVSLQRALFHEIRNVVDYSQADDALESAFHGCVKRVLIPERRENLNLHEKIKSIFTTAPKVSQIVWCLEELGLIVVYIINRRTSQYTWTSM